MLRHILAITLSALIVSACGKNSSPTAPSGPSTPAAPTITAVAVSAASTDLEVGQSTSVSATATFSNGTTGATTVTWQSDNMAVATVASNGQVTAVGVGSATIIAQTSSGQVGTVLVQVRQAGPKTRFGGGSHRVGVDIAAGRYFSKPADSCYWERVSGFGGSFDEIVANDFVGYDPAQYILDILPTDIGFVPDLECGTWDVTPLTGWSTTIRPGIWLVGAQLPAGTYVANASAGCYWERVRDFQNELRSIISNDFVGGGGRIRVTIAPGDVGFSTDDQCGTWTLESGGASLAGADALPTPADIALNFERARQKKGLD